MTAALERFGSVGFEADEDGGKCLFLYVWSTPESSWMNAQIHVEPRVRLGAHTRYAL